MKHLLLIRPDMVNQKNPNHLLKHNELLRMFRDFRCIRYHEGVLEEKKAVAGIIAEKGL